MTPFPWCRAWLALLLMIVTGTGCRDARDKSTAHDAGSNASISKTGDVGDQRDESRVTPGPLIHRPSAFPKVDASLQWQRQWPSVTGGLLSGLALSGEDGLVSTWDGELFRVTPAGHWTLVSRRWSSGIVDVASARRPDGGESIAVLEASGRIEVSEDGGLKWRVVRERPAVLAPLQDFVKAGVKIPYQKLAMRWVNKAQIILAFGGTQRVLYCVDGGVRCYDERVGHRYPIWAGAIGSEGGLAVAGDRGQVYRRLSASTSWENIKTASRESWRGVYLRGGVRDQIVVGGLMGHVATLQRDGHWARHDLNKGDHISSLWGAGRSGFVSTRSGAILEARDGGRYWRTAWRGRGRVLKELCGNGEVLWALGPSQIVRGDLRSNTWVLLRGEGLSTLRAFSASRALTLAAGDQGVMVGRRPGDSKWKRFEPLVSPRGSPDVSGLSFFGRFGWAATLEGDLWQTRDSGTTWMRRGRPSEAHGPLFDVLTLDARNVLTSGHAGRLYVSNDQGEHWNLQALPLDTEPAPPNLLSLASVTVAGGHHLWVGGEDGTMLERHRGRYEQVSLPHAGSLVDVEAVGEQVWTLDRRGLVFRRRGDSPWRLLTIPGGWTLSHIRFGTTGVGVAVGEAGLMLRTVDWGATWSLVNHSPRGLVTGLSSIGSSRFVLVRYDGRIEVSVDGGLSWKEVYPAQGRSLTSVVNAGAEMVACGAGGHCLSSVDGLTWSKWNSGPENREHGHIFSMAVTHGVMAIGGVGFVWVKVREGGWQRLEGHHRQAGVGEVMEVSALEAGPQGEVVALSGVRQLWYRNHDELVPLVVDALGQTPRVRAFSMLSWSPLEALIVLDDGRFMRWTLSDEGIVKLGEERVDGRVTRAPSSRLVREGGRLWLLGPGGIWAREKSGTWIQSLPGTLGLITDLAFVTATEGYASLNQGGILRSVDGGEQWSWEETGTRTALNFVAGGVNGEVYAGGEAGLVLQRQ